MTQESGPPERRLVRVPEGRMLAGVCTGLGRFTGIDPIVYRLGFALLALAKGQGVLIYVAAVLLMPAGPGRHAASDHMFRRRFDGGTVLAILGALLALGLLSDLPSLPGAGMSHGGPAGNALTSLTVLAIALLVAHARGVDLGALVRSMPERLRGTPVPPGEPWRPGRPEPWGPSPAAGEPATGQAAGPVAEPAGASAGTPVSLEKHAAQAGRWSPPEGMIDLARFSAAPPEAVTATGPTGSGTGTGERSGEGSGWGPATGPKAPRSILTPVTLLIAAIATAAMIPAAIGAPNGLGTAQILMAAALAAVGLGLVAGSVIGRGRGLVAVGALLTISLMATSIVDEVPVNGRYGDVQWHPRDASTSEKTYRMIVGDGRLDLTDLPVPPGGRVVVNARFMVGELQVTLPKAARTELHLKVALGDITVDRRITSGPGATVNETLQPEQAFGPAASARQPAVPPVIELHVKGRLGDLEVSRG